MDVLREGAQAEEGGEGGGEGGKEGGRRGEGVLHCGGVGWGARGGGMLGYISG